MDKNKVKGTFDDAAEGAKRQAGEWTGDANKQVEGAGQQMKTREVKGKAEKISGNLRDLVRDTADQARRDSKDSGHEREHEHAGHHR